MRIPLLLLLIAFPALRAMDPPERKAAAKEAPGSERVEIQGWWDDVEYQARISARTLRFNLHLPGVHLAFAQNGVRPPILAVAAKAGNGALLYTDIETSGSRLLRLLGKAKASLPAHLDKAEEVGRKAANATGDPAVLAQVEEWAGALGALRWALATQEEGKEGRSKGRGEARILQELKLGEQVVLQLVEAAHGQDVVLGVPWFRITAPLAHFKALDAPEGSPVEMSAGQAVFKFDSLQAFHRKQAELVRSTLSPASQAFLGQTLRGALETLWNAPRNVSGSTLGRIADLQIRGLYGQLRRGPDKPSPAPVPEPAPERPWTVPIQKPTLGTDETLTFTKQAGARFVRSANGDLLTTLRVGAFALHVQDRKEGREVWMEREGRETPRRPLARDDDQALMRESPDFRKDFEALAPELGSGFAADLEEALGPALELLEDPAWSPLVVEPLLFRMAELLRALEARRSLTK
ncbi:MAG TPA: hypothetical protein VK188_16165 [Holophaga sp.]|nr:hypothetical protein [Holophaga sp.]